ncbi:MAG: 2Fe-2S iron-sulfur cluster-binding protein [Desulfobacteraceae bacterium]|nr:2Fe-2S iron-sulfur cluster-binding protein [Desulfobacteraceae bacterium]
MITLTIDRKKVATEKGTTILEAAQQVGIDIPYFCYHKDMEPYGGCRLCMVEVTEKGSTRLQPSCAYPVKDNINVRTNTKRLMRGRKIIAELLLARSPNVDSVKNLAASFGLSKTRFTETDTDCVLCGQCVRVCRNVANVGAIDFVNRGRKRYVGTPYDLPSDECIGCGSCAYVCPTGAMNMEYENVLRWRNLPGPMRKCRYMRMGFVSHKICPNNFQCWNCEVDQRMEDLAATHPVFMLKQARAKEKETIDRFEIRFDRLYGEGHLWLKRVDGSFRIGIDDFARQIIGQIADMRLPSINTEVDSGDLILEISGSGKTLHMYSPTKGKIVDINANVLDNPSLVSIATYERGWIVALEPEDVLEASKGLLSGRSAKEWLKLESHEFDDLIGKMTRKDVFPERQLPGNFARLIEKDVWGKIEKQFFKRKGVKKRVKLHRIDELHSGS